MLYGTIRGILLSKQYVKDVGGLIFFEPTYEMFVHMIYNLKDKIQDFKKIQDFSKYKGTIITEEYLSECQKDENFRLEIKKKNEAQ